MLGPGRGESRYGGLSLSPWVPADQVLASTSAGGHLLAVLSPGAGQHTTCPSCAVHLGLRAPADLASGPGQVWPPGWSPRTPLSLSTIYSHANNLKHVEGERLIQPCRLKSEHCLICSRCFKEIKPYIAAGARVLHHVPAQTCSCALTCTLKHTQAHTAGIS